MKTKELIKRLSDLDPTGEIDCCVSNEDIFTIERLPAYHDGSFEVLKRDASNPYYNVIGAELRRHGEKIVIKTLSVENALCIDPELAVHCDDETLKMKISRLTDDAKQQ